MSRLPPRERLVAVDVLRGATVAAMLLVNNPGSWSAIYPALRHAAWHGWTPTDLIFPFFLFIVGITTELSLAGRRARGGDAAALVRRILVRGATIVLLGLLLAAFPFWPLARWTDLRIPGVLQRIGVVYALGALIALRGSDRRLVTATVVLLFGYWFAMTLLPVPGGAVPGALALDVPDATLAAWVDRALLDGHLWRQSRTWDPEGILSTVPAVATALLGTLAARWLGRADRPLGERVEGLFAAGGIATVLGLMWHWSFPINKNLWTSSYVLFTAGMAASVLATLLWVIERRGVTWWTRPFVIYGVNPLVAFLGSGVMARLLGLVRVPGPEGTSEPLGAYIHQRVFASWLPPADASLAFAVAFVLVWYVLLAALHRRGLVIRV